ncbi:MAG: HAMP domain-containing histidine kinase, partial [Acidobacteria bacterium]|nr:HAMP domain-containing histidine kinase [Acidobacteriota bacterium]
LDFLVSLGEQIAIALANSNLYEEKSLQIKGIKALNRVISKITAAANLNEIYKAAQGITKIIPNIHEMCLLKKKEDDYEMVFGCSNKDVSDCENCKKQGRECIKKDVGYSPYYCLDIEEDQYFKCTQRKDLKSRFVIPLVFEKELLAILDIGSKIRDAFSDFEQYLLSSLGSQIAIAINNHINQKKQVEIFKDISHTLGTYLTSVRGYTQLLVEEKVTDEASKGEYLKMLMGDVLTFINSVDEISSLTNIEKWDTASISSKIEIMDIIENLAAKNKFLLEEKQLKLTIPRLDDEKIYIKGDKQKLEEALQSLMNNAIKFSDEKKNIVIHVRIENDIVVIDISDQGYGIHKDDLGKIFEKYERGKEAKYRKIPGTGIGLALTKSIIERHSGTIGVESELGKGSTFTIKLPIYKEDAK